MSYTFDTLDDKSAFNRDPRAFWSLAPEKESNESDVKAWLNGEIAYLEDEWHVFNRTVRKNVALYRGIQYESQEARQSLRDREADRSRAVKKVAVNHLADLVEQLVSRQCKYKPGIAVIPQTRDHKDRLSAKAAKRFIEFSWYKNRFEDDIFPEACKVAKIMRESYLFITWNKDLGPVHPLMRGETKQIPLLDGEGGQVKDEFGNPVFIEEEIKVGDIEMEVVLPEYILPQKVQKWRDVQYVFRKKIMQTEELRLLYPEKARDIQNTPGFWYDYEKMEEVPTSNQTVVWEFFHKACKAMPKGRRILMTKDVILENEEIQYSHRSFPFIRLTDIDNPGELRGESFISNVRALTGLYNNYTNMMNRALVLGAQFKWMMPAGAAKKEDLGNDHTIVEFKGPTAPQLVTTSPISPSMVQFREQVKQEFQQLSGVFGVSRGEPPAGVKAGVALQFLSEQENERFNATVIKTNEFLKQVAMMTLCVAGDYYDESDNRMISIMGKTGDWEMGKLDVNALTKEYDIYVQNSSALPQSKAARTQTILDLHERFPDKFTSEQALDMLDLAQDQKFYDTATVAVRTAEVENEKMLSGEEIIPEDFEDHILHWKIHTRLIQEWSFKVNTPKENQENIKMHIMATEMLMTEKAKTNPVFAEKLMALDLFPMLYKSPIIEQPPMPMMPEQAAMGPEAQMPMPEMAMPEMGPPVAQPFAQIPPEMVNAPGLPVNEVPAPEMPSGEPVMPM